MAVRAAVFAVLLVSAAPLGAQLDLQVTGDWTLTLDASDLLPSPQAGADWAGTHETSGAENPSMTMSNLASNSQPWRIDVRRLDTLWPAGVPLYVRRTSDGTGPGTISGGLTYQAITAVDQSLFTGTGDRSMVDLQLRVEGVAVGVLDVRTYDTEVIYTLTET